MLAIESAQSLRTGKRDSGRSLQNEIPLSLRFVWRRGLTEVRTVQAAALVVVFWRQQGGGQWKTLFVAASDGNLGSSPLTAAAVFQRLVWTCALFSRIQRHLCTSLHRQESVPDLDKLIKRLLWTVLVYTERRSCLRKYLTQFPPPYNCMLRWLRYEVMYARNAKSQRKSVSLTFLQLVLHTDHTTSNAVLQKHCDFSAQQKKPLQTFPTAQCASVNPHRWHSLHPKRQQTSYD